MEKGYQKLWLEIQSFLSDIDFYAQLLSIFLCAILAYPLYKVFRHYFFSKIGSIAKKNPQKSRLFSKYLIPSLYQIFFVSLLLVDHLVFPLFFKGDFSVLFALKFFSLLLFLRMLKMSSNHMIANILYIVAIPTLIFDSFGVLDYVIGSLDQYSVKIGKTRFSLYLLIKAFVVLVVSSWLLSLISKKSKSYIDSSNEINPGTKGITIKLIDIFVYVIVLTIILKTLGVDITTLAVIGGAVGVGIGLGLQKIASNFISGIILIFEKTIEIDDVVELDNGVFGTIKRFGSRYVLLEAGDGKEIMIPNEEFIINKVTNWTYSNNRAKIEIKIGVAYDSNLERVKEIMLECAAQHPRCNSYPEPDCFISNFDEYDIKFVLSFWVNDIVAGRAGPKSDVMFVIFKRFRENGVVIPIPQREIRIYNNAVEKTAVNNERL